MLTGTIKAYSIEKKYGFIKTSDGESYFFHINDFKNKGEAPKIGQAVSFDDVPTPKGMAAKKIVVDQNLEKIYLPAPKQKFYINKNNYFGDGVEVVFKGKPILAESRNPDEALNHIKTQARVYGFNAIVSLNRSTRTGSKMSNTGRLGGYKFTIHSYTATPALVRGVGYSSNQAEIEKANELLQQEIEKLQRSNQKDMIYPTDWASPLVVVAGLLVSIFIFLYFF